MSLVDKILVAFIAIPAAAALAFVAGCYAAEAVRKTWRQR